MDEVNGRHDVEPSSHPGFSNKIEEPTNHRFDCADYRPVVDSTVKNKTCVSADSGTSHMPNGLLDDTLLECVPTIMGTNFSLKLRQIFLGYSAKYLVNFS